MTFNYSLILDGIIILIVAVAIFRGARKGLITAIFDMFMFLAAIIIAAVFKNPVAQYIMKTPIFESAKTTVTNALVNAIKNAGESIDTSGMIAAFEKDNAGLVGVIEMFGGDMSSVQSYVESYVTETGDSLAENTARFIMEPAANACSQVIAFAIVFLAALIALWLLHKLLNLVFKLPILSTVNKAGGVVIGFAAAFLYSSLFVALAAPLLSNPELFGFTLPENFIENSYIFSYLHKNNIFYYIVSLFTGTGNGTGVS